MHLQLEGLAAAVTGGSEGIGRAIAEALAREGCDVAIAARRQRVLEDAAHDIAQASGRRVLPIPADVSQADSARSFVETAAVALGRLDILVNNAGGPGAHRFDGASDEIWQADLDVKLFGAIRCARAALPFLRRAGGSIVNITSTGGREPSRASVPTTVTRAAGIALTKAMSKDYADAGVRGEHGDAGVDPQRAVGTPLGSDRPPRHAGGTSTPEPGLACRWAGSETLPRWPTWWPFWCRRGRRTSPARLSQLTAGRVAPSSPQH